MKNFQNFACCKSYISYPFLYIYRYISICQARILRWKLKVAIVSDKIYKTLLLYIFFCNVGTFLHEWITKESIYRFYETNVIRNILPVSFSIPLKHTVQAVDFSLSKKFPLFWQIGSGFGQSLIVADFNNDNKDDIAVGAPMEGEDDMNKVDVGAVYIYYGTLGSVRMCMRLFQHTCTVDSLFYPST